VGRFPCAVARTAEHGARRAAGLLGADAVRRPGHGAGAGARPRGRRTDAVGRRPRGLRGRGERTVWLCPALEYRTGEANDQFPIRSDWPLKRFLSIGRRTPSPHLNRLNERIQDLGIHLPPERIAEKKADPDLVDESDVLDIWWMVAEDMHVELRRHEDTAGAGAIGALEALARPERYFGT
jgi:hypothetical protein